MNITIGRAGGELKVISLGNGSTVRDALRVANIQLHEYERATIKGDDASLDEELEDFDAVIIVKNVVNNS